MWFDMEANKHLRRDARRPLTHLAELSREELGRRALDRAGLPALDVSARRSDEQQRALPARAD